MIIAQYETVYAQNAPGSLGEEVTCYQRELEIHGRATFDYLSLNRCSAA